MCTSYPHQLAVPTLFLSPTHSDHFRIKDSLGPSENLCRRARLVVGSPVSYRLFSELANYFHPPAKAHRNGADNLIECELNGCLGKQPARSRKLRQPK